MTVRSFWQVHAAKKNIMISQRDGILLLHRAWNSTRDPCSADKGNNCLPTGQWQTLKIGNTQVANSTMNVSAESGNIYIYSAIEKNKQTNGSQ
jgi:hypothetical protein